MDKLRNFWVSSKYATCLVIVNADDVIVKTSPIWRKFTGQKLSDLKHHLANRGWKIELLEE